MAGFSINTPIGGIGFSGSVGNASSDRYFQEKHIRNAIRYRVEDAKAAGVHPLLALGANVNPSAQPTGQASGGSGFKASIQAATERDKAAAEKDLAIAGYYDAMKAKLAQEANSRARGGDVGDVYGNAQTVPLHEAPSSPMTPLPPVVQRKGKEIVNIKGKPVVLLPRMSSQEGEDRWWEIGGAYVGINNAIEDYLHNRRANKHFFTPREKYWRDSQKK